MLVCSLETSLLSRKSMPTRNFILKLCAIALFFIVNFREIASFYITKIAKKVLTQHRKTQPSFVLQQRHQRTHQLAAAPSAGKKTDSSCPKCRGKEVLPCGPCVGTGIDKINGSVLERWCCKKCKVRRKVQSRFMTDWLVYLSCLTPDNRDSCA